MATSIAVFILRPVRGLKVNTRDGDFSKSFSFKSFYFIQIVFFRTKFEYRTFAVAVIYVTKYLGIYIHMKETNTRISQKKKKKMAT